MQNVFIKTIASIKNFNGTCRFSTWLYRIALNESINANRRNVRKGVRIDSGDGEMDLFPDLNASDGLSDVIGKERVGPGSACFPRSRRPT